jgi:hypothetical protein
VLGVVIASPAIRRPRATERVVEEAEAEEAEDDAEAEDQEGEEGRRQKRRRQRRIIILINNDANITIIL